MYALTRRIPEHQNMDQKVWKKRIKAAAIRLEGVMLLGSMAVVQMHATETLCALSVTACAGTGWYLHDWF